MIRQREGRERAKEVVHGKLLDGTPPSFPLRTFRRRPSRGSLPPCASHLLPGKGSRASWTA